MIFMCNWFCPWHLMTMKTNFHTCLILWSVERLSRESVLMADDVLEQTKLSCRELKTTNLLLHIRDETKICSISPKHLKLMKFKKYALKEQSVYAKKDTIVKSSRNLEREWVRFLRRSATLSSDCSSLLEPHHSSGSRSVRLLSFWSRSSISSANYRFFNTCVAHNVFAFKQGDDLFTD